MLSRAGRTSSRPVNDLILRAKLWHRSTSMRYGRSLPQVLIFVVLGFLILLGVARIPLWPAGTSKTIDLVALGSFTQIRRSEFLAHAPGFSVIKDLYWNNYTYFILTDQPWAVPDLKYVATLSTNNHKPTHGKVPITILSIRNEAVVAGVPESKQLGSTVSMEQAWHISQDAVELPGPILFNDDDNFVNHYYHWIGETFLGAWRIWSNLEFRTGKRLPIFKTVAFIRQWNEQDAPDETAGGDIWEDRPGANRWFTEKFFPGVMIESRLEWEERADTGLFYRVPLAAIADREGGHRGPSAAWKPWGDVLRLPVLPDWLVVLRDRVLSDYKGFTSLKRHHRPHVMYLARQDSSRRLRHEDHDKLVLALQALEEEGLANFSLESFNKTIPFDEQVARISTVDFLVGVHGNGLTHTIWLSPGKNRAVFEMQPPKCFITDYSPLATAAGVKHYMTHTDTYCTPDTCMTRGCYDKHIYPRGINTDDIQIDPQLITTEIRKLIAAGLD